MATGAGRGRKATRPPYAPLKGVRDFFEKVASKAPPTRVDRSYLASIGVAASNEQHLIAALKFLGLIDEGGRPAKSFDVLYLRGPERRRAMQNLLRQAYPSLFSGELELGTVSRAEIHDHFVRRFQMHGQMARKASALFVLLCTLGGITMAAELAEVTRGTAPERSISRVRRGNPRAVTVPEGEDEPREGVGEQRNPLGSSGLPIVITLDSSMSEDEIVDFLQRIKRAVARVAASSEDRGAGSLPIAVRSPLPILPS